VRRADLVFTDGVAGAMVECGDLVRAADEGVLDWGAVGDLADVVVGTAGRRPDTGIVLFESQGIALQDVATAALAYERLAGDRLQPAVDVHLAGEG
jgi:alanine dehydrogenase